MWLWVGSTNSNGLPRGCSGRESSCQCRRRRRLRFHPWVRKIPWNRKWQPTPGFLPGESQGGRSLVGYSPWGCKEPVMTQWLSTHYQRNRLWIEWGPTCVEGMDFLTAIWSRKVSLESPFSWSGRFLCVLMWRGYTLMNNLQWKWDPLHSFAASLKLLHLSLIGGRKKYGFKNTTYSSAFFPKSWLWGNWIVSTSTLRGPNLQDLMPDDLKWSWCNSNRNNVHNKYNALESFQNHPPCPGPGKNCLPQNQFLVLKRLGTAGLDALLLPGQPLRAVIIMPD